MPNWTKSKDGTDRADIRITHRISRDDAARLLILAIGSDRFGLSDGGRDVGVRRDEGFLVFGPLRKARIWELIRGQLEANADKANWWEDDFAEHYPGEPTAEEVMAWARKQVVAL